MRTKINERIQFHSQYLDQAVENVHVIDIQIGAIALEHKTQARAAGAGSHFFGRRDATRKITIKVELPIDHQEDAAVNYNHLRAWADTVQPMPMKLPGQPGTINCCLLSMSDLDLKNWYEPITCNFIAYDPYFYGTKKEVLCTSAGAEFDVDGDADADFVITKTNSASVSNPAWLIDGVQHISFTGSVGAGLMVIDSQKGLATLGDQSIMPMLNYETRFNPLSPGTHIISGSGGVLSWVERWR